MSRIDATFDALRTQGRKGLVPYVMAGDPHADGTVEVMLALAAAGADVIELGVPFSDPMAEGPVIQKACERALARGVTLATVLAMVRSFRARDAKTPVVLMGYANPLERYDQRRGEGAFVADARDAGVDGVLVVDYPPEECETLARHLQAAGMDPIFLLAPTSTEARMSEVGRVARGYAYCVSLTGVTGASHLDVASVAAMLPRIRRHVSVPLAVGFGIRDAATAKAVAAVADAVVIGSRLVQLLEGESRDNAARAAGSFIAEIRRALDSSTGVPTP
jgi:tryptophan synthase alpha chain